MRYFSLAVFLTLVMGFAGCGGTGDSEGEAADAGNGATEEMAMEEMRDQETPAMDDMGPSSDDTPAWQMLEQNVVYPE